MMLLNVSPLPELCSCSQWQLIFAGERRQRSALAAYLNHISHQLTHQGTDTMTIQFPILKLEDKIQVLILTIPKIAIKITR